MLWFILLSILVAPIAIYSLQFGFGIWSKHEDWATMGSALGGIYSPIIALLAFFVIFAQTRVQLLSEQHSRDMVYIHDAKQDFNFYIERLDSVLSEKVDGDLTVSHILVALLDSIPDDNLLTDDCIKLCQQFAIKYQKFWAYGAQLFLCLKGWSRNIIFPMSTILQA